MKKFLTIIGISVLSLSMFAGCGGSDDVTTTEADIDVSTTVATTEASEANSSAADAGAAANSSADAGAAAAGDTAEMEQAAYDLYAPLVSIINGATSLSDSAKTEFTTLATQFQQEAATITTADKMKEWADKFKAFAESNNITVKPITSKEELQQAMTDMMQGIQNLAQSAQK